MSDSSPRGANVFYCGTSDSGKSTQMWECYTRKAPRIITIEIVEETLARDPGARRVFGWSELKEQLAECAEKQLEPGAASGSDRWHIVASLERDEVDRLFRVMCPPVSKRDAVGYGRAVGGVIIACNELQKIAPKSLPEDSPIKDGYLRGRHHWLAIHGATQHGADCNPSTRMQVKHSVFLRASDELSLGAVARASTKELAARVETLPEFHSLTWVKHEARAYLRAGRDADYKVYDVLNNRGISLSRSAATESTGLSPVVPLSAGRDAGGRRSAKQRQRRA